MGLISDYLEYRRIKKYYKKLLNWEREMMAMSLSPAPPEFESILKGKRNDTE